MYKVSSLESSSEPMGSQSGREERRDESFENLRCAFSPDLTDCPKVSQDAVEFGVSAIEIQVRYAENVPTDIIHLLVLVL